MISGLRLESRKLLDYDFREAFPDAQIPTFPLGRKAKGIKLPVFTQGNTPLCVPCSVLWISEWFGRNKSLCKPQELASNVGLNQKGALLSQVLDVAYKAGLIPNYVYVRNPTDEVEIEKALGISPLIIGLWDWPLVPGGHAMVLLDRLADGSWLCVNWANPNRTDYVTLPSDTSFVFAVAFADINKGSEPYLSLLISLIRKLFSYAIKIRTLTRHRF